MLSMGLLHHDYMHSQSRPTQSLKSLHDLVLTDVKIVDRIVEPHHRHIRKVLEVVALPVKPCVRTVEFQPMQIGKSTSNGSQ